MFSQWNFRSNSVIVPVSPRHTCLCIAQAAAYIGGMRYTNFLKPVFVVTQHFSNPTTKRPNKTTPPKVSFAHRKCCYDNLASSPSLSILSLPSLLPLWMNVTPASQAPRPNLHILLLTLPFAFQQINTTNTNNIPQEIHWIQNNKSKAEQQQNQNVFYHAPVYRRERFATGEAIFIIGQISIRDIKSSEDWNEQQMQFTENEWKNLGTWWLRSNTAALSSRNFSSPSIVKVRDIFRQKERMTGFSSSAIWR